MKIKNIVYTTATGDLFHYGHLRLLQNANEMGDFHICGVLTDEAIESYKESPIASLRERKSIFSELRCVDMVMVQDSLDRIAKKDGETRAFLEVYEVDE